MGRSENFYKFKGFDRQVNLGWTVAAQSKQELNSNVSKIKLFSFFSCWRLIIKSGYLCRGNLITLTMGGWFYEQPGFTY